VFERRHSAAPRSAANRCAQSVLSYNSCRGRHCPKCLTAARNAWVAAREQELLPVGYVHLVFTVPAPLARLALANKRVVYDLVFRAAAATLLQVAVNPKRLGAMIGGLMVLHTWGQRLQHHPHVPLCRACWRTVTRGDTVDPCASHLLSPGEGYCDRFFRGKLRRRPPRGVSRGTAFVSRCLTDAGPGVRLSRVAPDRSTINRGWSTRSRPLAVPPTCWHYLARYTHRVGHLQSPARRRHRRRGLVFGGRTIGTGARCAR